MMLDDMELLTNAQVASIYNDVYNNFWLVVRNRIPDRQSSDDWEKIVEQAKRFMNKYQLCPLAVHMIQDLIDQLEARSKRKEEKSHG